MKKCTADTLSRARARVCVNPSMFVATNAFSFCVWEREGDVCVCVCVCVSVCVCVCVCVCV